MVVERTSLSLILTLWRDYVRPQRFKLGIAVICMVLSALCTALLAKYLEPVFDQIFTARQASALGWVSGMVMLIFFVRGVSSYGQAVWMNDVGQYMMAQLQQRIFSHLMSLDFACLKTKKPGHLSALLLQDIQNLRLSFLECITNIIRSFLTLVSLLVVMMIQNFFLTCMFSVMIPLVVVPLVRVGRRMRKFSFGYQECLGDFQNTLNHVFQNIHFIKGDDLEKYEIRTVQSYIEKLISINCRAVRVKSILHPFMEILGGIAITIIIAYGGYETIFYHQAPGKFFSFVTAMMLAYEPMKRLAHLNAQLQSGLGCADRLLSVLAWKPVLVYTTNHQVTGFESLKFSQVSFAYPSGSAPVVRDVSFTLKQGEKIAFVGPNGCGKSTLLHMMLRFYDPHAGEVFWNDTALRTCDTASLRREVSFLSQEPVSLQGTIRDYLTYGYKVTEKSMVTAAKKTGLHGAIIALDKGYDAVLGIQGHIFSGGQRQKLALTRALLKKSSLLLLDEVETSLDPKAMNDMGALIGSLPLTVAMVTHERSFLSHMDRIYVMERGQIQHAGQHATLMKASMWYQNFWQHRADES